MKGIINVVLFVVFTNIYPDGFDIGYAFFIRAYKMEKSVIIDNLSPIVK